MKSLTKIIVSIAWLCVVAGAGAGALTLIGGMSMAQGAPQEAVVCALSVALAVLPYCFARAVTELAQLTIKKQP